MKQQTQINKTEWKEIALGEIFDFENKTGIKAGEGLKEGKYKFFTSSDNQSKFLDRFNFKGEHLIFSTGGKAGLHYCNEPFSVSNDCFIVKVKSHSTKFIYYLLKSKIYLLEKGFKGAGLKHLSKDYLKKIKVKLPLLPNGTPDLKEQERIVKILEENERQLKRTYRAEELLNEYLRSVFNEMFYNKGFEIKKIRDVLEYSQYGTSMKSNSERKGYKVLGMNSITYDGHIDISKHNYVDITKEEYNKLKLENGDIIFNRTNSKELVGKTAYWNLNENVVLASYLVKLRLKKIINPIFFTYLLNTNKYKKLFEMRSRKAVNQANLSPTLLKEFEVMLPPLPLQQKFSRIVEQVEKMKENVNKTKQNAEELFNSLMQKAFKGELD